MVKINILLKGMMKDKNYIKDQQQFKRRFLKDKSEKMLLCHGEDEDRYVVQWFDFERKERRTITIFVGVATTMGFRAGEYLIRKGEAYAIGDNTPIDYLRKIEDNPRFHWNWEHDWKFYKLSKKDMSFLKKIFLVEMLND